MDRRGATGHSEKGQRWGGGRQARDGVVTTLGVDFAQGHRMGGGAVQGRALGSGWTVKFLFWTLAQDQCRDWLGGEVSLGGKRGHPRRRGGRGTGTGEGGSWTEVGGDRGRWQLDWGVTGEGGSGTRAACAMWAVAELLHLRD